MDEVNKPQDGLEHIAKEAAEKAHFDFNPEAWAAMEAKLDAANRKPFAWWKILFPIGVVIILLLLIKPWGGESAKDETGTEQAKTDAPATKQATESGTEQLTKSEEAPAPVEAKSSDPQAIENDQPVAQDQGTVATDLGNVDASSTTSSTAIAEVQSNESTQREEGLGTREAAERTEGLGSFSINLAEAQDWVSGEYVFPGKPGVLVRKDSFGVGPVEEEKVRKGGAWNFLVSADLSVTRLDNFTNPGTMVGVLRESYFGNNWSFSTGLAYSVKKYSALGEDYTTPPWAQNAPEDVLSVLANCIVVDVPLNLRRYFQTKNGNQFFISGGISSYFMIREDYDYDYGGNRPAWTTTWRVRNENQHFFGVLNFSAGFERPLTNRLALGIEPYVKVPLTGIGFGEVDLLSFGVNLALKLNKK